MTYQDILNAKRWLNPAPKHHAFRQAINSILAAAEDNARDDHGRIASIIVSLSFPSPDRTPKVVAWFADLGIVA